MPNKRDDFSEPTKRNLARRVAYRCSMPSCQKSTEGPHTEKHKYLSIGVAAHITAAAIGGPRYDSTLTNSERKDINNGIWLCETHAKLIDKDPSRYSKEMLFEWKEKTEEKALAELEGRIKKEESKIVIIKKQPLLELKPYLEAELRLSMGGQYLLGSGVDIQKTNRLYGNKPISPFDAIRNYRQEWIYEIIIYNNSSVPAYNIELVNKSNLNYIEKLPKVNNIPPLGSIKLKAHFEKLFDGTGKESSEIISNPVPLDLIGNKVILKYYGDKRDELKTILKIGEEGFKNEYED